MKLGMKLIGFFAFMAVLTAIVGVIGFSGIKTVSKSLTQVGDEEAPLVDMANEMKLSMMVGRNAMEEYKGATSPMSSLDSESIDAIIANFETAIEQYDAATTAILEGKTLSDGTIVVKTDNDALSGLVRQADELHATFQKQAGLLMAAGKELIAKKGLEEAAMEEMEETYEEVMKDSGMVEKLIAEEIARFTAAGNIGQPGSLVMREEVPLAAMANELKIAMAESRIILEEAVQMIEENELAKSREEYRQVVVRYDRISQAMLNGGDIDGTEIIATDNNRIRTALQEMDDDHGAFQKAAEEMLTAHHDLIVTAHSANQAMSRLDSIGEAVSGVLTQVERAAGEEMVAAKVNGATAVNRSVMLSSVVTAAAMIAGIVIGFFISRSITVPMGKSVVMLEEMAMGRLQNRLQLVRADEIGQMAKTMDTFADNLQNEVVASMQQLASGDGGIWRTKTGG